MGRMLNGVWGPGWFEDDESTGTFIRPDSQFRSWITADGSSGFRAKANRYHLYISYACPWAHRALIVRNLKGLDSVISLSIVDPVFVDDDWAFNDGPGCIPDTVNNFRFLHQVYKRAVSDYTGIVTVPALWDKKTNTIVNNESSEIIRMFNSAFGEYSSNDADYYPEALQQEIDEVNQRVYRFVNNGVYRVGFACSQAGYERSLKDLFQNLDWLEDRLGSQRYLIGSQITEADWRLFTTLVRFDSVYVGHFKCNLRTLTSYPNLWGYTRELYQYPGIANTVNMDHIKRHYYMSHERINPNQIVPAGPELNFDEPHCRDGVGT